MNTNQIMNIPYVFLDSGIGGLPYLEYFHKKVPHAKAVYIADTKHFPYGEKTQEQINMFVTMLTEKIISIFNPSVIILACNTMSVTALSELRKTFDTPFIGTVPAIKLAAETTKNKRIGVLATEKTIQADYFDMLINEYAADCYIEKRGDANLIAAIEHGLIFASGEEKKIAMQPAVAQFMNACVDTIVLACTHFLHILDTFRYMIPKNMQIVDSLHGVITQTLRIVPPPLGIYPDQKSVSVSVNAHIVKQSQAVTDKNGKKNSIGYCYVTDLSSPQEAILYRRYCERFNITWSGIL